MNRQLLCTILCCIPLSVFSQIDFKVYHEYKIPEVSIILQMGHHLVQDKTIMNDGTGKLYYENIGLKKESMLKAYPVNMIIRVSDINKTTDTDIEIPYNDIDIDLSGFMIHYIGDRKFVVFRVGRYLKYILNISNNRIIGPFFSKAKDGDTAIEASDSQDGTLSFMEIFNNGQYLIGYANNFEVFCFNLMDLYNPISVDHICEEGSHNHKTYFFLDKRVDNIYNGFVIRNHVHGKCDPAEFLFQGIRLRLDENGNPYQRIVNGRYVELQKTDSEGNFSLLKIDFLEGIIEN